jgi:WD40 repeat protein
MAEEKEFDKGKNNENDIAKKELKFDKESNPQSIELLSDLVDNSFSLNTLDNSFIVFKSIDNIIFIIYSTVNKSIICYNLNDQKETIEIRNYHSDYIINFRHQMEKVKKRDLIMSISKNNNIRIWNFSNWECLLNITDINEKGYLYSACFLYIEDHTYIITSNYVRYRDNSDPIKIFDLNGNKIKEISNSKEKTIFIDVYYDNKNSQYYILTGNECCVESYDYNNSELYHSYNDVFSYCFHNSILVKNDDERIKLIDSCNDGNILIWDFHSGLLLNKINISEYWLCGMCLWNNDYIFVGCSDKTIKLVDLKKGLIKSLNGHDDFVITVKKIILPEYGECLISQNNQNSKIKIWKNSN